MRKWMYGAVVLLWMAVIISFSHQTATSSNELSYGVTERLVAFVELLVPSVELNAVELHHMVRKNAHFLIYLVLGILVMGTLTKLGMKGLRCAAVTLLLCVLFAVSDEVHQLFVIGRGAQVQDVLIDSAGAVIGMGLYKWVARMRGRSAGE
ncbi:VanZ family protein [Paenibacillus sp. PL2-23]|uniref:VanZ family protein n=1 Tax=Paenibacillus sp. PL2-23 TaxID=2100729 RepID=UPI0030F8D24B